MAQRQFNINDTSPWPYRFGGGADGALTVSSNTTFSSANAGCSGTAGSTSLVTDLTVFTNGDLVLIHQTAGTGAGQWELNTVASGGGTTSLTLGIPLINTYTDSAGASQAQVVKLKQYSQVTVNNGVTWTAPAWDGNRGGILAFLCLDLTTIAGSINAAGLNGADNSGTGGSGVGFNGGAGFFQNATNVQGFQGGGIAGGGTHGSSANGNGGGGGATTANPGSTGGSGGGNGGGGGGNAGGDGGFTGGSGGSAVGSADLVTILFGGGGGGGGVGDSISKPIGGGGGGGGLILIITRRLTITGSINLNGGNGGAVSNNKCAVGGAGAGGSCLIKAQSATLGSSLVTATGGSGGISTFGSGATGGAGGAGRIHLDYLYGAGAHGSTNPTLDERQDPILQDAGGSFIFSLL